MKQQSLRQRIRLAYRQYPQADSATILELVRCKDTNQFRAALVGVQNELRHFSVAQRTNHHAHPLRRA